MSLPTQTTAAINDAIVSQLQGSLGQTIPFLPKAALRVIARVVAGVFILLYKYVGFNFLQLFVAHATADETVINGKTVRPLVMWGRLIGVGDPEPATQAELIASVTVLQQDPTKSIPANQLALRSETGITYKVLAPVVLNAPIVQVRLRAVASSDGGDGSGDIGNLQAGDVVSFANPLPNIASDATIVSQAVTGADAQSIEAYRKTILDSFRSPPQGGAYADYRKWARTVAGIVNVYPYTGAPGQVDVFIEADAASSGSVDGIPTDAQVTAVFTAIQGNDTGLATLRPVNAAINVKKITRRTFDIEIEGLTPDSTPLRDEIQAGADEFLRAREPFIVGLSVLPRLDRVTEAALGGVVESIVEAAGASMTSMRVVPGPGYSLLPGEKAKLGGHTYV